MEFASYLSYRHAPVDGAEGEAAGQKSVASATSAVNKDDPCVSGTSLSCRAFSGPDRGDLVIVLPDDEASLADASAYRAQGNSCSYEPRPRIPQWLRSLVRNLVGNLRMTLPIFGHNTLPDPLIDRSVTLWICPFRNAAALFTVGAQPLDLSDQQDACGWTAEFPNCQKELIL
jgi:hypothetical protein